MRTLLIYRDHYDYHMAIDQPKAEILTKDIALGNNTSDRILPNLYS